MAIRTLTLTKNNNPFYPAPKIEFTQGETVILRLTDSDNDLNNKIASISIKEGLAIPGQNLYSNTNLLVNNTRTLTVNSGFANITLSNFETAVLTGNKVYTLQIEINLGNGTEYTYCTYEVRVRESLVSITTINDVFNPAFWVSPETLPTTNGAVISTWFDRSGYGRDITQANNSARPTVVANAINNFNIARFDGVDDFLRTTNFVPINTGNYSYFVVYSHPTVSITRDILQNGADIDGFVYRLSNSNIRNNNHGGFTVMQTTSSITPNTFEVVSVVRNNTPLATMEVNGTNQTITNPNISFTPPTFGLTVGSRQGDHFANADVAEILVYNKALSTSQRLTVTNYLKNKYNI
jgi:hypothetical protein